MFRKISIALALTGCALWATSVTAKPSINDAQQCQAVIDFTIARIGGVDKYDAEKVATITAGLTQYEAFLQSDHIDPGLLAFTGNDAAKAAEFQTQIDAYKAQIVTALNAKHPQPRIFTDQAVAIDNCYTAAPMDAAGTEVMTTTLQTLLALAMQG